MRWLNVLCALSVTGATMSCGGTGTSCPEAPAPQVDEEGVGGAPSAKVAGRASPVAPVSDVSNVDIRPRTYAVLVEDDLVVRGGSVGVSLESIETIGAPRALGHAVLPGSVNGLALLRPNLVAAGCAGEGLFLVDITSPPQPRVVGHVETNGAVWRLSRRGGDLLAADGHDGVAIFRAEASGDRVGLREVGRWTSLGYVRHVEPWGEDRALAAEGREGLAVLELADPSRPRLLSRLDTEGEARAVAVRDSVAFVADFHHGVVAVDLSDPVHMTVLGRLETSDSARDVIVIGEVLAVAMGTDGVLFANVTSASSMEPVGRFETALPAVRFTRAGSNLAVAVDSGGVEILDVSDPSEPRRVSSVR